jgi:glycosyltransferase involved in cell wall biosynthesis
MAKEIRDVWPDLDQRLHVVPNAIDPAPFRNAAAPRTGLKRHRLTERPFVLAVGHREPRKNLPTLIRAVPLWRDHGLPHGLVIVGRKVRGFDEPEHLVRTLGLQRDVLFAEDITAEELPAIYRAAAVFCFLSFYEGFGIPLLEAAAAGTPIVAANTDVFREVIGDRACVDPEIQGEVASEIIRLIEDEGRRGASVADAKADVAARGWDSVEAGFRTLL